MTKLENAELREDTIESFNREVNALYARYGHLFKSYEDCEYFYMLPLSKAVRESTLQSLDERRTYREGGDVHNRGTP